MESCLLFVPESSGAVSVAFLSIIGVYLGLDVAGMISKTSELPKGQFKELNTYKYIITGCCLIVLTVTSILIRDKVDVSMALTSFISSMMIILTCLIGGLEGNNIATDKGN
ncbi:MAG: hypothetical protein KBT03_02355 [Bacteroidales bacterium]|nr:hypothetical protein [Candidatus Scybalousia scybalohippi]